MIRFGALSSPSNQRGFGPTTEVEVMLNDPFQLVLALILVIIIGIFEELR